MKFHKLVRDLIPEIIQNSGKQCTISVLSQEDYQKALYAKLNEEVAEYQESKSMEEIADILEGIRAIVKASGSSMEEVERIRQAKCRERGGFEKRILLEEVTQKEG